MAFDAFQGLQKKEMTSRTFHLGKEQIGPLKFTANVMGISQSEVVRRSINLFIEELRRRQQKIEKKGKRY
jgi:hypothetical protein